MMNLITRAVVDHYLETSQPSDADTIAERLGWSVARVRRTISASHGAPPGTSASQEVRPSYSKSYRSFQHGSHRVWVYYPTLGTMRALILGGRQ